MLWSGFITENTLLKNAISCSSYPLLNNFINELKNPPLLALVPLKSIIGTSSPIILFAIFLNACPAFASVNTIGSPLLVDIVISLSSGTTPNNFTERISNMSYI